MMSEEITFEEIDQLINKEKIDWIENWMRENRNKFPPYNEHLNFYKHSKYVSFPFKIFERFFNKFWRTIKNVTLRDLINEDYFKVTMFLNSEAHLIEQYYFIYTKKKSGNKYIVEIREDGEENLMFLYEQLFTIPYLLLNLIEKKEEEYKINISKSLTDNKYLNNELFIAFTKLKDRNKKAVQTKNSSVRYTELLREKTFENNLKKIADETRKKNGKLNFSAIASKVGISNHTAKKWCVIYKIPFYLPYLSR